MADLERLRRYRPVLSRGDHDLNPDLKPLASLRAGGGAGADRPAAGGRHHPADPAHAASDRPCRPDRLPRRRRRIRATPTRWRRRCARPRRRSACRGSKVEILGRLDTYVSRTGFEIQPFVGLLTPPLETAPDPFEVAEIFEVPLDFILAPTNPKLHRITVQGRERQYYAFPYRDRYVWGVDRGHPEESPRRAARDDRMTTPHRLSPLPGWATDAAARAVINALSIPGFDPRFVGGCVRDALLGRDAADVDIATPLRAGGGDGGAAQCRARRDPDRAASTARSPPGRTAGASRSRRSASMSRPTAGTRWSSSPPTGGPTPRGATSP